MSDAPHSRRRSGLATNALAFAWGLAEATIFFILPDVLLTRLALRDPRSALRAGLSTLAGAVIGGTLLWFIVHENHDRTQVVLNTLDWIPGITRDLMVRTAQALHTHGFLALGTGALLGQPYKLFAVHAGAQEVALTTFLLASVAGTAVRIALTTTLAWLAGRVFAAKPLDFVLRLQLWLWMGLYAAYFALMR